MDRNELYIPSVWRVLRTDYWSFFLIISAIAAGFFAPIQPFLALPLLVLLTVSIPLRVRSIRRTFATGSSTEARVVGRMFSRVDDRLIRLEIISIRDF